MGTYGAATDIEKQGRLSNSISELLVNNERI